MAAGFGPPEQSTPRVDPIPLVFGADDWQLLSAGIAQRVRLLGLLADDLYGDRALVRRGLVPVELCLASSGYRAAAHGWAPPEAAPRLSRYAADIVRDADGRFCVVEDHTDTPVGAGRALLLRSVLTRLFGVEHRGLQVQPLGPWFDGLRGALAELVPAAAASRRVVLLAPAPHHPDYTEHALLATHLGYNLVDAGDLVIYDSQLYLRAIGGLEPIGVLLRAIADSALDPLEIVPPTSPGVAGLVQAARAGHVGLSNAVGSGLVGMSRLHPYLPMLSRELLGEDILLPSFIDPVKRATVPVLRADELCTDRYVMRLQAVQSSAGISVLPGGVARSSGGVKDVWIVGEHAPIARATYSMRDRDPIDLRDSLPCRAAEALFWLGRNAEHAESVARCVHVALSTVRADPELAEFDGGAWAQRVTSVLGLIGTRANVGRPRIVPVVTPAWCPPPVGADVNQFDGLVLCAREALSDRPDGLADTIGHLVSNAATVREFLSTSTWRLTAALQDERHRLMGSARVDGVDLLDLLDRALASLAAFAGLMQEGVVRGPGWRFFDLGRRLERSRLLVTTLRAAFSVSSSIMVASAVGEFVLAGTESLVAYRRRYRTDIDIRSLIDLLVREPSNPRSLAFQLDRVREDLASLPSRPEGDPSAVLVEHLASRLADVRPDSSMEATLVDVADLIAVLTRSIASTWFSPAALGRDGSLEFR